MAIKKFLSLEKLEEYDALIKEDIAEGNAETLASAKSHSDTNLATSKDYTDTVASGKADTGHTHAISNIENLQITLDSKAAQTSLDNHINNKSNPHGVTLSQLGVTATATELNYVDGVTSNIQTQISSLSSEIANLEEKLNFKATDDGNGNVTFETMPFMSVEDDGSGNIVIY